MRLVGGTGTWCTGDATSRVTRDTPLVASAMVPRPPERIERAGLGGADLVGGTAGSALAPDLAGARVARRHPGWPRSPLVGGPPRSPARGGLGGPTLAHQASPTTLVLATNRAPSDLDPHSAYDPGSGIALQGPFEGLIQLQTGTVDDYRSRAGGVVEANADESVWTFRSARA